MNSEFMENDPEEMKIARKASWLCNLFQWGKLTVEDKKEVLRDLMKEYKQRRFKNKD